MALVVAAIAITLLWIDAVDLVGRAALLLPLVGSSSGARTDGRGDEYYGPATRSLGAARSGRQRRGVGPASLAARTRWQ